MIRQVTGKTKIYFMMAHPIGHVRSPEVFNPIFEQCGIDAFMVPVHYNPEDFERAWEILRVTKNLAGFMTSIPLKEMAYRLSDEADESAKLVEAANTVRRLPDGRMVCANFDGLGFMQGVLNSPDDVLDKRVLLVGSGGAGASIASQLALAGVEALTIADLNGDKATALASRIAKVAPQAKVEVAEADPAGYDVVINATPCGLHPETDPLPVDPNRIERGALVADIVMKPRVTPLLAAAEARGCEIRYGAGMLDRQVELAMAFWGLSDS